MGLPYFSALSFQSRLVLGTTVQLFLCILFSVLLPVVLLLHAHHHARLMRLGLTVGPPGLSAGPLQAGVHAPRPPPYDDTDDTLTCIWMISFVSLLLSLVPVLLPCTTR